MDGASEPPPILHRQHVHIVDGEAEYRWTYEERYSTAAESFVSRVALLSAMRKPYALDGPTLQFKSASGATITMTYEIELASLLNSTP